ncbi:MAG: hypothetical protein ACOY35_04050 [Bacillota bacterium]|nr:hypothetical protein [Bacillota bacterium]
MLIYNFLITVSSKWKNRPTEEISLSASRGINQAIWPPLGINLASNKGKGIDIFLVFEK